MSQEISVRELKLTAVLYALRHGVLDHVKRTGRLPDKIKSGGLPTAMRVLIERRGTDIDLAPDEELVLRAILRAVEETGHLPGGAVILIDQEIERQEGDQDE
jgi:hypothetical protein